MSLFVDRGRAPGSGPTRPENTGMEGGPFVALPPWLFQPRGAPTVQREGSALIAPLSTAILFTIEPGQGYILRVSAVGFGANDPTALTNATFSFIHDGRPVQGYGGLSTAIGHLDQPADVVIIAEGPGPLALVIANNFPANAWTYFARAVGWLFTMGTNPVAVP